MAALKREPDLNPLAEYRGLRFWHLHELRRLRAAARVGGSKPFKERRELQKHLAAIRKRFVLA